MKLARCNYRQGTYPILNSNFIGLDDEVESIRGLGVSPGICTGRAVVLGGTPGADDAEEHGEPVILVAKTFSPEEVVSMDGEHVCGFITATGGMTDPAGIIARAAGLPAVLAYPQYAAIQTGDLLIIDGEQGDVVRNPAGAVIDQYGQRAAHYAAEQEERASHRYLPAETRDGLKLDILASIDLVDALPQAITSGAHGIGLFRSEFYYLTDDGAPSEEFLFSLYQHTLSMVAPLPVTIRTLDLSGDSQVQGLPLEPASNPALGLKGIRFSLAHPALFKTQLRALYRASSFGKLRILLPMISSVDELREVKVILAEVEAELAGAGVAMGDDVEVGLMVEVPASVFVIDALAREVDFLAIGINDLIQYGLGIDRGCSKVAHLYEPLQPALLRMLDRVIRAGHHAGIEVGVCGEMAGEPQYTPLFLGLGVDWLSMPAAAIGKVKKMVRDSRAGDCTALARFLLQQSSAALAKRHLQEYHASHSPDGTGERD